MKGGVAVVGAFAVALLLLGPASAADADNGKRLAERWCTGCHAAGVTQSSAVTEAPSFHSIASKPDFDAKSLALFLLHPHPKMPDMGLSREAATDLAAFIATQRQPRVIGDSPLPSIESEGLTIISEYAEAETGKGRRDPGSAQLSAALAEARKDKCGNVVQPA